MSNRQLADEWSKVRAELSDRHLDALIRMLWLSFFLGARSAVNVVRRSKSPAASFIGLVDEIESFDKEVTRDPTETQYSAAGPTEPDQASAA